MSTLVPTASLLGTGLELGGVRSSMILKRGMAAAHHFDGSNAEDKFLLEGSIKYLK